MVLRRRQQICFILCFKKEALIFFGEGSHVVHGTCCQGNHVLCLYMSRPVASFRDNQTVRSKETENANYDIQAVSDKLQCDLSCNSTQKVFTLIMYFFKCYKYYCLKIIMFRWIGRYVMSLHWGLSIFIELGKEMWGRNVL